MQRWAKCHLMRLVQLDYTRGLNKECRARRGHLCNTHYLFPGDRKMFYAGGRNAKMIQVKPKRVYFILFSWLSIKFSVFFKSTTMGSLFADDSDNDLNSKKYVESPTIGWQQKVKEHKAWEKIFVLFKCFIHD